MLAQSMPEHSPSQAPARRVSRPPRAHSPDHTPAAAPAPHPLQRSFDHPCRSFTRPHARCGDHPITDYSLIHSLDLTRCGSNPTAHCTLRHLDQAPATSDRHRKSAVYKSDKKAGEQKADQECQLCRRDKTKVLHVVRRSRPNQTHHCPFACAVLSACQTPHCPLACSVLST